MDGNKPTAKTANRLATAAAGLVILAFAIAAAPAAAGERGGEDRLAELEKQAFDGVNRERAKHGLPALAQLPRLANVARKHSQDQARRNTLSHTGGDGSGLQDRIERDRDLNGRPLVWRALAENVAYNHGYDDPADAAVRGWMNSPPHRKAILEPKYAQAGLGAARAANGEIYFTQVFLQPAAEPADIVPDAGAGGSDAGKTSRAKVNAAALREIEKQTLDGVNRERFRHGLLPVARHDRLDIVARRHGVEQAREGRIDHSGVNGSTLGQRIDAPGDGPKLPWRAIGEILAMNNRDDPVDAAVKGWMKSPGHRKIMLNGEFNHAGLAVVYARGRYYFTMVFMRMD